MFSKLLLALLLMGSLGTTVMWATSYTHYTSVGIDQDQRVNNETKQVIEHSYYRVRWPGNGSIWLGGGKSLRPLDSPKPFEPFDLAATFLHPQPVLPPIESSYNKAGFWYKFTKKPSRQIWFGIPAWLPVIIFSFFSFVLWKKTNSVS